MQASYDALMAQSKTLEQDKADAEHNAVLLRASAPVQAATQVQRAADIAARLDTMRTAAADIMQKIIAADAEIAAAEARQREQAEIDHIRSIPRLRRQHAEQAALVERLAEELGEAMRGHAVTAVALADALDTNEARRVLSRAGNIELYRTLNKLFGYEPPGEDGGYDSDRQFITVPRSNPRDQTQRRSLSELTAAILAERAGFYATRHDAEVARRRVDPSGETLHVIEDTTAHVWTLRSGRLRGGVTPSLDDVPDVATDTSTQELS
jgi:hypothetical protein